MLFPRPPAKLLASLEPCFEPAYELREWALSTFVRPDAELVNPDHKHLRLASVLFVWSSVPFKRTGQSVVGTAQMGRQQGSLGKREFLESMYRGWNGGNLPDFVITIVAPYVAEAAPEAVCALVEHEMYHCGQARDEFGFPKFTKKGLPVLALRGHDVEEFVGVVARYGATSPDMEAMHRAMTAGPTIARSRSWNAVCGCGARV